MDYSENFREAIVHQAMSELDTEIESYLKKHPVEHMPPRVRNGVVVETPKLRFRVLGSKVDPGWTRKCAHCWIVQQVDLSGQFGTFYHDCEILGTTVEWPPSIGRDYA